MNIALLFLLQIDVDTKIPLWGILSAFVLWLGQLIWQLASSHFTHKATKERFAVEALATKEKFELLSNAIKEKFAEIKEANEATLIGLRKELEHLRKRNMMDLESVKKETDKDISGLKEAFKEYTGEVKELRDIIVGLSKSVDLLTLRDMKTNRNKNGG